MFENIIFGLSVFWRFDVFICVSITLLLNFNGWHVKEEIVDKSNCSKCCILLCIYEQTDHRLE